MSLYSILGGRVSLSPLPCMSAGGLFLMLTPCAVCSEKEQRRYLLSFISCLFDGRAGSAAVRGREVLS